MHVSEPKISAGAPERELLVVEAEQPQHRRVKIVDMDFVLGRLKPIFIRSAMNISAAHSASRHPGGEAVVIMIAAIDLASV